MGQTLDPFANAFAALYVPDASHEQIEDMVRTRLASAMPEAAVALRRVIDGFDVPFFLPQLSSPALILHAHNDAVHPLAQSHCLATEIPDAEFRLLDRITAALAD